MSLKKLFDLCFSMHLALCPSAHARPTVAPLSANSHRGEQRGERAGDKAIARTSDKKALNQARAVTYTVVFPPGSSLGKLSLVSGRIKGLRAESTAIGAALGVKKVTVPAGRMLAFEPNRLVFENPALLEKVSPDGIECLRLKFTSLDDREDTMCDRVLDAVNHLSFLRWVDLARSDVSDRGLAKLKKLPHLEAIECPMAPVSSS